jgi:exodeoxyribonuclease VII large subunit
MGDEKLPQRRVYTVSELTGRIHQLLEERFPMVWIAGELSNLHRAPSGHLYFSLKDATSQIAAAMFSGQNRRLRFDPQNGTHITGLGRLSVYEPRGTLQLIIEYMEPSGIGAAYAAYEQLKKALAREGLFDAERKKQLPFLPRSIGLVTSLGGAVIHDVIRIIERRFPAMTIRIVPAAVQGAGAEESIAAAIELLNAQAADDLILLARGGGAFEDFHAFNSEAVARAIFRSTVPVLSGVGHETDFTIADLAADRRAPTPSAAAELAVPEQDRLEDRLHHLKKYMKTAVYKYLDRERRRLDHLGERLIDPRKAVRQLRLRLDDMEGRLLHAITRLLGGKRDLTRWRTERLLQVHPERVMEYYKRKVYEIDRKILYILYNYIAKKSNRLTALSGRLKVLDPRATLERGYCIARTLPQRRVLLDTAPVKCGDNLELTFYKGILDVKITNIIK